LFSHSFSSHALSLNDHPRTGEGELAGDRKGQHSIRVNAQWRICFVWNQGAENVEIVDYH
jgi:plasmid maintenance system killer protein